MGELAFKSETFVSEIEACSPSGDVLRDFVGRDDAALNVADGEVDENIVFSLLVFADEAAADGKGEAIFGNLLEHVAERNLRIKAANVILSLGVLEIEILAFHSPDTFQHNTLVRGDTDSCPQQAVVDAELPVLVGAECEAITELFVERTGGHLDEIVLVIKEIVGETLPLVADILKVNQREKSLLNGKRKGLELPRVWVNFRLEPQSMRQPWDNYAKMLVLP